MKDRSRKKLVKKNPVTWEDYQVTLFLKHQVFFFEMCPFLSNNFLGWLFCWKIWYVPWCHLTVNSCKWIMRKHAIFFAFPVHPGQHTISWIHSSKTEQVTEKIRTFKDIIFRAHWASRWLGKWSNLTSIYSSNRWLNHHLGLGRKTLHWLFLASSYTVNVVHASDIFQVPFRKGWTFWEDQCFPRWFFRVKTHEGNWSATNDFGRNERRNS